MKTRILTISLIALVAIGFSSCDFHDKETYYFGQTEVIFDPDFAFGEFLDFTSWNVKEVSPSGKEIRYYFDTSDIPWELSRYKIRPKIKNEFNSFVYPDSSAFELMKKRGEMWLRKIDSVNSLEIQSELNSILEN